MELKNQRIIEIASYFNDGNWIETKDQATSGYWLVQTGNIGVINFRDKETKRFVNEETFRRLNCTEILPGDILISRLPEPVGRSCIVPKTSYKMLTAVDCTILRLKDNYDPSYINYILNAEKTKSEVYKKVTGSSRKRISRKNLGQIEIPISHKNGKPCLNEQKRIANKLTSLFSEIDKAIEKTKEAISRSEGLLKSQLSKVFFAESEEVKILSLKEIVKLNYGEALQAAKRNEGEYSVYGSNGIVGSHNTYCVSFPTIIIGRKGSVGKAHLSEKPCWVIDTAFYTELINPDVDLHYLYFFCQFLSDRLVFPKGVKPGINRNEYLENKITIPTTNGKIDIKKQRKIVEEIESTQLAVHEITNKYEIQLHDLEKLKQSLLNQAFEGKL